MIKLNRSQRLFLALSSGILLFSGWSFTYEFLMFLGFVPLLIVEHYYSNFYRLHSKLSIFLNFYLSFFTWNAFSVWWIYYATFIGAILAISINSLFMTIVFFIYHLFKRKNNFYLSLLFFIIIWLSFEYIHFNWELSWPWLTLGNGLANLHQIIQWYEYTGVLGGSLWILISNVLIFSMIINWYEKDYTPRLQIYSFILLILIPTLFSIIKYLNYKPIGNKSKALIIQPNIDPYEEKFDTNTINYQMTIFKNLIINGIDNETKYIILPETALPIPIWEDLLLYYNEIQEFIKISKKYNVSIITGASTYKKYNYKATKTARLSSTGFFYDAFNSALLIYKDSIQIYHKSVLVLGVEKMPFSNYLKFLEPLALDLGGTSGSLGIHDTPFVFINKIKFTPAICYESVYGEYLSKSILKNGQCIIVITNDGWWNNSPGYKQHLMMSKLRAIEFRKDILRSANTGISAYINQKGDIVLKTNWWTQEYLSTEFFYNNKITFYTLFGDYIGKISCIILIIIFLSLLLKKIKHKIFTSSKNSNIQI